MKPKGGIDVVYEAEDAKVALRFLFLCIHVELLPLSRFSSCKNRSYIRYVPHRAHEPVIFRFVRFSSTVSRRRSCLSAHKCQNQI